MHGTNTYTHAETTNKQRTERETKLLCTEEGVFSETSSGMPEKNKHSIRRANTLESCSIDTERREGKTAAPHRVFNASTATVRVIVVVVHQRLRRIAHTGLLKKFGEFRFVHRCGTEQSLSDFRNDMNGDHRHARRRRTVGCDEIAGAACQWRHGKEILSIGKVNRHSFTIAIVVRIQKTTDWNALRKMHIVVRCRGDRQTTTFLRTWMTMQQHFQLILLFAQCLNISFQSLLFVQEDLLGLFELFAKIVPFSTTLSRGFFVSISTLATFVIFIGRQLKTRDGIESNNRVSFTYGCIFTSASVGKSRSNTLSRLDQQWTVLNGVGGGLLCAGFR